MTKCNIKNNIKNIIIKLKLIAKVEKDKELADIFEVDRTIFSSWKNQTKQIPIDSLIEFCNIYNISLDWLLRDKEQINTLTPRKNIKIPLYADFEMENIKEYITFPGIYLPIANLNPNIVAFVSNTNEFPESFREGVIVFFDTNNNFATQTPAIFWINANGNNFIRRISLTFKNQYLLTAENKHIRDETVDQHNIEIIAKFAGVLKWKK